MRSLTLSIAAVERDTGLSKDTLRVWERRYGFPQPGRDDVGERAYPLEQVERLRVVKRLMDGGHRPGQVVALPLTELQRLSASTPDTPLRSTISSSLPDLQPCLDRLAAHDIGAVRRYLLQAQMRLGLGRFVVEVVVPLNSLVGDAWMRGQLAVFQEHAYSEALQIVLRSALASLPDPGHAVGPRVLLTTFPGEPHGLGLLMAEALFALEGAHCVSLGVQTPVADTLLAARAYHADIVALAFTGSMIANRVIDGLAELRDAMPPAVEVWAGGMAPVLSRRPVAGVRVLTSIGNIAQELQAWRVRHADNQADGPVASL